MSTVDSDIDVRLSAVPPVRASDGWLNKRRQEREPRPANERPGLNPPEPPPVAAEAEANEVPIASEAALRWSVVPGWLVSLVVHLCFLIALGLLTLPPLLRQEETTIAAAILAPPQLETLADVVITPPLEEVQHVAVDAPAGALAELTDLTNEASLGEGAGEYVQNDVDAIDVGEMGEVFGSGGKGLKVLGGGNGSAEFFGVKAGGRRFVFIVDSSNSMRGQKFTDAKEELMYAVRRLDKSQAFYVIFFDQDALRMFDSDKAEPAERPVAATLANIQKLETWMKTVENERRTDPYDAVKFALEMRPDAIFILSDGQFTDRGRTVEYLARENIVDDAAYGKSPRVVVHTIGFYSKDGEVTLEAIAKAYKGTYRFVAPPQRKR